MVIGGSGCSYKIIAGGHKTRPYDFGGFEAPYFFNFQFSIFNLQFSIFNLQSSIFNLQRIFVESIEYCGEISFTRVGEKYDDVLALVFRSGSHLCSSECGSSR